MNRTVDLYVNESVMVKHKIIVMPGVLHAINFSLRNSLDKQTPNEIRLAIADNVFSKWKDFPLLASNEYGEPFNSKMDYCRSMTQLSTFGGASELKEATHLYSIKIELYNYQNGTLLVFPQESSIVEYNRLRSLYLPDKKNDNK